MKKIIIYAILLFISSNMFAAQAQLKTISPKQLATIIAYDPFTKTMVPAAQLLGRVAFDSINNQSISRQEIEGTEYFSFFKQQALNSGDVVIVPRGNKTYTFGVVLIAGNKKSTVQVSALDVKIDVPNTCLGQILYEQEASAKPAAAAAKK